MSAEPANGEHSAQLAAICRNVARLRLDPLTSADYVLLKASRVLSDRSPLVVVQSNTAAYDNRSAAQCVVCAPVSKFTTLVSMSLTDKVITVISPHAEIAPREVPKLRALKSLAETVAQSGAHVEKVLLAAASRFGGNWIGMRGSFLALKDTHVAGNVLKCYEFRAGGGNVMKMWVLSGQGTPHCGAVRESSVDVEPDSVKDVVGTVS